MKYQTPEIEIVALSAKDVITASGITGGFGSDIVGGGGNLED